MQTGVERTNLLHSLHYRFPGGSGLQRWNLQQGRGITADGWPVLGQQVDEIKLLRLGKLASLRDTGRKLIPWEHGLDGREGVDSLRFRFDERPANFSV